MPEKSNQCMHVLNHILEEHAGTRVNGNVASDLTSSSYGTVLKKCFKQLHTLGFRLQDPRNLNTRHVEALCRFWLNDGREVSTIHSELSKLRIFCGWIGKEGMVRSLREILTDMDPYQLKVSKVAKRSKSWTENGIDVSAKIKEADALDWRFGLMLRMCLAFGLRRKEVVQLKPWKSDKGDKLAVYEAKNGRPRDVYIDTPEQRAVLDFVKSCVKHKTAFLGWNLTNRGEKATLEYSVGKYNKCMASIGITKDEVGASGHGLRAQFAENAALIANMIPPTLGGTGGQMDRDDLNIKRAQVSELLGHSRISVTASYYGSFGRDATKDEADRCKKNIEKAIMQCSPADLKSVPTERMEDCTKLLTELAKIDVEVTARQVQMLWEVHSKRHASDWVKPTDGNAEALEAAALKIFKQQQIPLPEIG